MRHDARGHRHGTRPAHRVPLSHLLDRLTIPYPNLLDLPRAARILDRPLTGALGLICTDANT